MVTFVGAVIAKSIPNHQERTKIWMYCVEAGIRKGCDADGNDLIVTETMAVNIGNTWWLTKPGFDLVQELTVQQTRHRH